MTRKMWPKSKYKDLIDTLFNDGKLLIKSPDIARQLGKELNRLEIRADVFIGRDQMHGNSIAVVLHPMTSKQRNILKI